MKCSKSRQVKTDVDCTWLCLNLKSHAGCSGSCLKGLKKLNSTPFLFTYNTLQFCHGDDQRLALCIIRDTTNPQWNNCKITVTLPLSMTARDLCEEIAKQANYETDTFNLVWQRGATEGSDDVLMSECGLQTLEEVGLLADRKRNFFQIQDKDGIQPVPINAGATGITVTDSPDYRATRGDALLASCDKKDDTQPLITAPTVDTCATFTEYSYSSYASAVVAKSESGFVGLINQAMTCYLNSLLQTLYMTPEFRNALYKWCFDESVEDPSKSIPYQLQRLFVQLQTSKKRSIETYDLTRSFGWDSSEAWHQHDVQELCRVMFDALETKFKNTENEDLINRLYQGQMKDYVKCLECTYESARKDSFLDIPLVIRPFGSTKTYGSVQEALQAFVMPETLKDTNQYFCEHCNKKCDAHKGLKFQSFPYVLTLQLKRFDFDYTTCTRIKLNDKVTFPELLNMSDFLEDEKQEKEEVGFQTHAQSDGETDDFESPNILADSGPNLSPDDTVDEGIDVEQASQVTASSTPEAVTPYLYELFSIMVHSGTANGGHYYAYIKSFSDGQWYCFNDTSVTHAGQDDIRRTYGIEALPGRSAPNSTLPNAYMLMYRRVEPDKNAGFVAVEQFPLHIKELMVRIQNDEEEERRQRELDRNTCKIKLFGVHPLTGKTVEARLEVHKDKTLREATEIAQKLLGFDKHTPLECCRLVKYDEFNESLEKSFEGEEDTPMGTLLWGVKSAYMFDLLLETRREDQEFVVYRPGGVTNKVFVVDLEAETIASPISLRSYVNTTVQDFKTQIAEVTGLNVETLRVVWEKYYNDLKPLVNGHKTLKNEGFSKSSKVFVESSNIEDKRVTFLDSKLYQLLDRNANTIRLQVTLPLCSQDDFKPPKSNSVSPCPSPTSSTDEKYNDLQLETDIAMNTVPTPSPTGSSSTLSDDHPLDKNSANLLGSETDSGVVSLNDTRIHDDLSGDNDGNSGELRGSPEGATAADDDEAGPGETVGSEDHKNTEDVHTLQSEDQTSKSTTDPCWCDDRGCGDCSQLQQVNSEPSSGAVSSPLSPLSSLSSPMTGTSDNKSGSIPSHTDPGAGGETRGSVVTDQDPNEDSEDEIYENTRHTKPLNWYFKAEPIQIVDNSRLMPVYVDKRMSLAVFKKALEPYVGTESQNFKVYRVYANNQEFESIRLTETLQSYSEDSRVVVKLGRALKKGEYRVKIYQLDANSPEPCKYLFDWVFAKGMSVLQSKTELLPELKAKCLIDVAQDRLRLRKKAWKNPGTIYANSQLYEEDIPIFTNWEVFIEILDYPEPVVDQTHLVLFVRRWRPSEFKVDPFEEVILADCTVHDLKKELSRLSGISMESIAFAKGKGTFPCEISLLEMQTDLEWNPDVTSLNSWPLYISDDGAVIYYCDRSEGVKELTEDEKQEIVKKESSRFERSSQKPSYPSPRKERALKIYTDHSNSA
ncbi:ubiquitin carboxyl-terminal hydrolase 47-like isoform X2 [Acanthaster planci]|uniref:Ubiquitin carboxyl-terminal hydrolase 47 n=1 Tax=Acanthaster planci TaxID=133434 RepID=A0A8B7ZLM1_ACAPL|nr:ubiquitin carboxyl-terminal hydrolase 47-like isoform X2 [Acanthaster planci]